MINSIGRLGILSGIASYHSHGSSVPVISYSATVVSDVYDPASATVSPATVINDPIFIDMNGAALSISGGTAGEPDATKVSVTVARSGFDLNKNPMVYYDVLQGSGLLRNPYPANDSRYSPLPNTYLTVLTEQIYTNDVITNVTLDSGYISNSSPISINTAARADSVAYPNPISGILNPPYDRIGSSATYRVEIAVGHKFARQGQQVAAVEIWIEDANGTAGPITTVNSMSRSQYTPETGYVTPRFTPALVYSGNVSTSGLIDGTAKIHYKIYPFCGPVYSSKTGLQTATWPTFNQPSDGWPVIIDVAGNHREVYAWVNQDGTAGASAAVQTTSTDPGSSGSYATPAAAAAAIKTYNNANRGHNDLSGGVIMLRDVPGSTAGANAGSYSTRGTPFNSVATYPAGLVPLTIRAASGVTSQLCRWRGQQADGTIISSNNKAVASRIRWENVYFDSVGLTGTDHIAIYGAGAGLPSTQPTLPNLVCQIFFNCIERGNPVVSTSVRWNMGYQFDYMMNSLDPGSPTATGAYNYANGWSGLVSSIGSSYVRTTASGRVFMPRIFLGGYVKNITFVTAPLSFTSIPIIKGYLWGFFEVHGIQISSTGMIYIGASSTYPVADLWLGQFLVRATIASASPPLVRISADGSRTAAQNIIVQYGTIAGQRFNGFYNDQGFWPIPKSGYVQFCSFYDVNNKRDTFSAPETPITSNEGTWVANKEYYQGMILYDGVSNYYQATTDVPAGIVLANTSYWFLIPNPSTPFSYQPRRLGAMRYACGVGSKGNAFTSTSNGLSPGSSSWYGEFPWKDTGYSVTLSYVSDTSQTGTPVDNDDGNYVPTGAAQMNKVRTGEATLPVDLRGNARKNDGTGACGCLERA